MALGRIILKSIRKAIISMLLLLTFVFNAASCDLLQNLNISDIFGGIFGGGTVEDNEEIFYIKSESAISIKAGEALTLECHRDTKLSGDVIWTSSASCVTVNNGVIKGISQGIAIIKATLSGYSDYITVTVTVGDNGNIIPDGSGENNGDNGENTDDVTQKPDDTDYIFGSEYETITVDEAIDIAKLHTSEASDEKYYIVAKIDYILDLSKGEMTISDETESIYVYKSTDHNGASLSGTTLSVGDMIIIYGTLRSYRGLLEIESSKIISYYTPGEDTPSGAGFGDLGAVDNSGNISSDDPYQNVDIDEFYRNYTPATSYLDAYYRTKHGLMSGKIDAQAQEPTISTYRPTSDGKYIRNSEYLYSEDGLTYYVVDAYGEIVFEVYKGAAYVVLEEVAAYVFAFGEPPANQTTSKDTEPEDSIWGKYLRLNHTQFSGDTSKYPYEPKLPNITGCGGSYVYYEMDIGTLGTDCDPSYTPKIYNNGKTITRGAARIVYSSYDRNNNKKLEPDEKYVFYTYNHYNDFEEYLNYLGGWGEMFGNITGGGKISSKTNYNPTPYPKTVSSKISAVSYIVLNLEFIVLNRETI